MSKYVYPAIFTKEENLYSIIFPDLPNCISSGNNMQEAIENAEDALCLILYHLEKENKEIPCASDPICLEVPHGSFISLVNCDTMEYEKFYNNKAVKKTLTIPQWLNEKAMQNNINFSAVLQNALMEQLNIDR